MTGREKNNPLNIEKLLIKAASDEEFKKSLFADRKSVIESPEFSLSPQDKMILSAIPSERLQGMIEKFSVQKTSRRNFLKFAAVSAAFVTTSLFLNTSCLCSDMTCTGARPIPPVATQKVGPDGDMIDYMDIKIVIPEKALPESVDIICQVTYEVPSPPEHIVFYDDSYQISPEDIKFSKDISISFAVYGEEEVKIYFLKDKKWTEIEGEKSEGRLTIKTKYLGIFARGYKKEQD